MKYVIDEICLLIIIYVDISLMFTKIPTYLKTYDTHFNVQNILFISKEFNHRFLTITQNQYFWGP